jgi:hypothetical protein
MSSYYDILKTLFLKDGAEAVIYEIKRRIKGNQELLGRRI